MMETVVLDVSLPFATPEDRTASEHVLTELLGFNALIDLRYLDRHPQTPRLYDSGVKYCPPDQATRPSLAQGDLRELRALLTRMKQEPEVQAMIERILRGVEIFLDVPALLSRGKGDCNELTPMRVAELWQAGVPASPLLIKERNRSGGWAYHAAVKHPDGSQEDPSRILGMGDQQSRLEEIRKNVERWTNHLQLGQQVIEETGMSPALLNRQMSLLGFLPKDGVFRVGGPPVDLLGFGGIRHAWRWLGCGR